MKFQAYGASGLWTCDFCGYIMVQKNHPLKCSNCLEPDVDLAYSELYPDNPIKEAFDE